MIMQRITVAPLALVAVLFACSRAEAPHPVDPGDTPELPLSVAQAKFAPPFDPAGFVAAVDNPYFPLVPGTVLRYEAETEDGTELGEVTITSGVKNILGISATVVRDRVFYDENGNGIPEAALCELHEETFDWYGQDAQGNVWYLGEDSSDYEDCVLVSKEGSWESGVDGATPGIIMPAHPRIGMTYQQEFYPGVAEDAGHIVGMSKSVSVPAGEYDGCLQTMDYTPLEPGAREFKFYCLSIGLTLEISPRGGRERNELVGIN
jgi:ribosomal protein S18 acetylase RimI-like enzyme